MLTKIITGVIIVFSLLGFKPQRTTEITPPITLEQQLVTIFGNKTKVAIAVFKHESNLNPTSINYNCRYNGKSTFCKKKDIKKAWSVDCGIAQINVKGKVCPPELLTLEGSLPSIKQKYKEQGLSAWCSFKNKGYKKYL